MSRITWPLVALVLMLVLQLEVFILLWAIYVKRPNWLLEQQIHQQASRPFRSPQEADTLITPPAA